MHNFFELLRDFLSTTVMSWDNFEPKLELFASYCSIELLNEANPRPENCTSYTDKENCWCIAFSAHHLKGDKIEFITVLLLFYFELQFVSLALVHADKKVTHDYVKKVSEIASHNDFLNGIPKAYSFFATKKPFLLNDVPKYGLAFCKKYDRTSIPSETEFVENIRDMLYIYNKILRDKNSV